MCGRICQFQSKQIYTQALGLALPELGNRPGDRIPNWNVQPGSQPWLLHRLAGGLAQIEMVNWGYRPAWADETDVPLATAVRADQARTGPYFKTMFRTGRAVVPADGWYEWVGRGPERQPWFIRLKCRTPVFIAAICSYRAHNFVADGTGFVILNAASGGGMVDAHGQRPIVFEKQEALRWIDHAGSLETAVALADHGGLGRHGFECFPVGAGVDRLASNGPHLISPLPTPISA